MHAYCLTLSGWSHLTLGLTCFELPGWECQAAVALAYLLPRPPSCRPERRSLKSPFVEGLRRLFLTSAGAISGQSLRPSPPPAHSGSATVWRPPPSHRLDRSFPPSGPSSQNNSTLWVTLLTILFLALEDLLYPLWSLPLQSTCRSSVCVSIIVHLTTQTSHFFTFFSGGSLSGHACACACECACSYACACAVFEEYILFQDKPSEYDFFVCLVFSQLIVSPQIHDAGTTLRLKRSPAPSSNLKV